MHEIYSGNCQSATAKTVKIDNSKCCINLDMSGIGKRIKEIRTERGLSLPQLATKVGLKYQTIQNLESGKAKETRHLLSFARALGVRPEWLEKGELPKLPTIPQEMVNPDGKLASRAFNQGRYEPGNSVTFVKPEEMLEVLGLAIGGPDGWNLWNGEVVQTINKPDNLIGIKGAYGVLIRGTSMSPRYDPNMIAHVHPWQEPVPGDYVVVQRKPLHPGDPPLAVVKRLVRRSASKVTLEQLSPPERFDVPASQIVSVHKIVGSSNA